jgi:hypothetical protein
VSVIDSRRERITGKQPRKALNIDGIVECGVRTQASSRRDRGDESFAVREPRGRLGILDAFQAIPTPSLDQRVARRSERELNDLATRYKAIFVPTANQRILCDENTAVICSVVNLPLIPSRNAPSKDDVRCGGETTGKPRLDRHVINPQ